MSDYVTKAELGRILKGIDERLNTIEYELLKNDYKHQERDEILRKVAKKDYEYENRKQRNEMAKVMYLVREEPVTYIAEKLKISKSTVYKAVNQ